MPAVKEPLDQFGTFEVFVQPKEGKPFQHEGSVHAPNPEMAYILAKEAFTRRFLCASLSVADTKNVYVSPMTEGDINVYDIIPDVPGQNGPTQDYEIYHLLKRGKQHIQAGTISATTPQEALSLAKKKFKSDKTIFNVWVICTKDMRYTTAEEKDLWQTLPDKKFRDAADYKGGDKLKEFLERPKTK